MYYRSGTDVCCMGQQTIGVYSPNGGTFPHEIM